MNTMRLGDNRLGDMRQPIGVVRHKVLTNKFDRKL